MIFLCIIDFSSRNNYTICRKSRAIPTKGGIHMIIESAKVMSKGQITLPKEIREALGVSTGDRVTIICDGSQAHMMNSSVYALKFLQDELKGLADEKGLTEDDIMDLVAEIRNKR